MRWNLARLWMLCMLLISRFVFADVTLSGHMDIGDNNTNFLNPNSMMQKSGGNYVPEAPIHFALSKQTTVIQIALGSGQNAIYPVNFIVWDSNGNTVIDLTQANNGYYTLNGAWSLPAGDYQMAVMGACVHQNNNNWAQSDINSCLDKQNNHEWDDISFTDITLVNAQSNTINFIQRQHIGDNTDTNRWYPSQATGLTVSHALTFSTAAKIDSISLYGLADVQYSNVSYVSMYQGSVLLWQQYITANGTQTKQPALNVSAGITYTLVVGTQKVTQSDAEDIDWDDIVLKYTPIIASDTCNDIFPYPVQGRSDTDYIDFNSSQNYFSPQVLGTINGVIGYKYESQLIDRGYTYQHGWYGDKIAGNCDGKYCLPSGQSTNSLSNISNPFPLTVSSQEYSVGWSENKTLSTGSTINYKRITVDSSASLNISASGLKTSSLSIGWNSVVTFAAGEYWIETLTMDDSAKIILAGKVTLHVKTMSVASHSLINSSAINASGTPENLLIILHGALTLGSQATLSGFIYQTDDATSNQQISLISPSYIFGRINAKRIVMTDGSVINGAASTCPTYTTNTTNHYELQYSSANITCEPASITIRACSDAATPCTLNSAATDSVSLTASPTSSFSSNPVTLSGGTATTTLSHYIAENVKLGLSTGSPTCLKDGVVDSSCNLPFISSVLSFNFPTFYAGGNSGSVILKALKSTATASGAQCSALFSGNKTLSFTRTNILPATLSHSITPSINGTDITSATPVTLNFNASGEASMQLAYAEAGVLGVTAAYSATDNTKGGTLSVSGSDLVAVLPSLIQITANDQIACSGSSDATYAACSKYKPIETTFGLTGTAGFLSGSTFVATQNFSPESGVVPTLTHDLLAPTGGTLPVFTSTALSFNNGVITPTVSEGDVGVYRYGVTSFVPYPSYQDETTKLTVPLVWSNPVGRIYATKLAAAIKQNGTLTTTLCNAHSPTATLAYTGQSIGFSSAPILSVTAVNSANAVLPNYRSSFAKITSEVVPANGNFVAGLIPQNNANALTSTANWANGSWTEPTNAYTHQYVFGSSSAFTFAKPATPVTPFETQLNISTLQDSDGATVSSLPLTLAMTTPAATAFQVYSGRLHLDNANAAETDTLNMPFYLQYWNGTNWVLNAADNCSTLSGNELLMNGASAWSNIALATSDGVVSTATTSATLNPATVVGGAGVIQFSAPNSTGWVDVTGGSQFSDWMKDSSETNGVNPARASFGFFRGNDRLIYRRDVFNN